jgi:acyl-CoA dehydrogenase
MEVIRFWADSIFGMANLAPGWFVILSVLGLAWFLGYFGASIWLWGVSAALVLWLSGVTSLVMYGAILVVLVIFGIPVIRRYVVSFGIMQTMIKLKLLPVISETEQEAIDAGTVWIDRELFSGRPDFKMILSENYPKLTVEERAFMDGPVETVCQMIDPWETNRKRDLSEEVWAYLKQERFFGMIISKKYGGLEFSAYAHSCVIAKLASRSIALSITVMVPNSLGPGELLTHYGTQAQKDHYLPKLATGEEIPCFALTEPTAGSDAGAIKATGQVFKGQDGQLYLELNWTKRWITLAAISTVIGIAFKLSDPDNLLEKGRELGITCALIPSNTPGVILGKRHDPLDVPFYNCPTQGKKVIVPIDAIIGGKEGAGKGWRMLMESLSAGRGISLPSNSAGGAKMVSRAVGAFSMIRQQFGMSVGKFEGVQEALARIAGFTYILDASRTFTCGALDNGAKPAVVTAIAKYHSTELFRKVINDGMDIMGGAAISEGPRNVLASSYKATPIGITVEGANILTRTLMIFGQGAIRCHPFVLKQIQAINARNVAAFDKAFFGHIGHVIENVCRAKFLTVTFAWFAWSPVCGSTSKYYRKLKWASAVFAVFADIALATLGGNLKRREMLTGRFADVLSYMYLATATLRRFEAEGRIKEDLPLLKWSLDYLFAQIQLSFLGICQSMPILKLWGVMIRIFSFGSFPSDSLSIQAATVIQKVGLQRNRLTADIFIPQSADDGLGRFDHALVAVAKSDHISVRIKDAIRKGTLPKLPILDVIDQAVSLRVISQDDADAIRDAETLRLDAIQVDDFTLAGYLKHSQ